MTLIGKSEGVESVKAIQQGPFHDHYKPEADRFNDSPERERSTANESGGGGNANDGMLRRNVANRGGRIAAHGMPKWVRDSKREVANYIGAEMTEQSNSTTPHNPGEPSSTEWEPVWEVCGGAAFPDNLAASPTERRPRHIQQALLTSNALKSEGQNT